MTSHNQPQALEGEEHLFILEWGDRIARLLYAFCEFDKVISIDGFSEPSEGLEQGTPVDDELACSIIRKLIEQCQSKHQLQIQTLFILIKSGGKCDLKSEGRLAYRVPDIKPYLNFLEKERQGITPFSSAHLAVIPHHCDLFDAFDSQSEAFRHAFALPSRMREKIQHCLLKVDCFAEGFLSLPRIGVKARDQDHPGLVLGIFPENSVVMVAKGDDLIYYREFPFCLDLAISKVQQRLQITRERAERITQWITQTPNIEEFDQGHPEDQALYLSKDFVLVKNDIADELDHLTISIKDDLIHCDTWDLGFDRIYLLGEGQALYQHFTFLRDNLPFEPLPLPCPYQAQLQPQVSQVEFVALIRLIDRCLELRAGHRAALERGNSVTQFKKWARRLFVH
jgi:hypothetical protein